MTSKGQPAGQARFDAVLAWLAGLALSAGVSLAISYALTLMAADAMGFDPATASLALWPVWMTGMLAGWLVWQRPAEDLVRVRCLGRAPVRQSRGLPQGRSDTDTVSDQAEQALRQALARERDGTTS